MHTIAPDEKRRFFAGISLYANIANAVVNGSPLDVNHIFQFQQYKFDDELKIINNEVVASVDRRMTMTPTTKPNIKLRGS